MVTQAKRGRGERDILISIPNADAEKLDERARRNVRWTDQEAAHIVLQAIRGGEAEHVST